MMEKKAEDDRIELMNSQKKRMKLLQHKREVEQMLEDRRMKLAQERQSAFELAASERREQDRINKLIEEERLKMIEKVSQDLLGYLPKGIIRDFNDLEPLGEQYKEEYRPK